MKESLQAARTEILRRFGASPADTEELLRYTENRFAAAIADIADIADVADSADSAGIEIRLPLADEPFVATWRTYLDQASRQGAWAVLARALPQLSFPIRAGISQSPGYRRATRAGAPPAEQEEAGGLGLERPELVEIRLHATPAGAIPLILCSHRPDFVALVQALAKRNEPEPVPPAQGAVMITGYINWERVRALRKVWQEDGTLVAGSAFAAEKERALLDAHRDLYQDRIILLSDGPYSGVPAADLGLVDHEWRDASLAIRREHECTHYFTRRLFGAMSNNVLDELIADWAGITAVTPTFRADWFLRFVGLEAFPAYRLGARLDIYRGKPPLSDRAFTILQALLHQAAHHLEAWDRSRPRLASPLLDRALVTWTLATCDFETLAGPAAIPQLEETARRLAVLLKPAADSAPPS